MKLPENERNFSPILFLIFKIISMVSYTTIIMKKDLLISIKITNDNKNGTVNILKVVEKALEYLFSKSPLVTTSYLIICIFINIMNYEFVYNFLLEQITPMCAQRGDHKSVTAANDCFLLSNQHCLNTQPHFSYAAILRNHYSFFNSYLPIGRKIYIFLSYTLKLILLPMKNDILAVI